MAIQRFYRPDLTYCVLLRAKCHMGQVAKQGEHDGINVVIKSTLRERSYYYEDVFHKHATYSHLPVKMATHKDAY